MIGIISHFADFEQFKIKISHFADFEQVITKISHFDDFEQVKQYYHKIRLRETRCLSIFFFEATALCQGHSTLASQTCRCPLALCSTLTLGFFFFECVGIRFFNSSHVSYGTPCSARGHSHSPKEAEDFPRGGNHSKHMPPLTYLP